MKLYEILQSKEIVNLKIRQEVTSGYACTHRFEKDDEGNYEYPDFQSAWMINASVKMVVPFSFLGTIKEDLLRQPFQKRYSAPGMPSSFEELLYNETCSYPDSNVSVKITQSNDHSSDKVNEDLCNVIIDVRGSISSTLPLQLVQDIMSFTKSPKEIINNKYYEDGIMHPDPSRAEE